MKKFIWIPFLLICSALCAQENSFQSEWKFGANAGLTFSRVRFNPHIPQNPLMQGTIGVTARYISEKHFGVQVELNYAQRGWDEKTDTVINLNEYSRSLSYLELPIMTHIYFNLGKRARMVFNLGPQIGYNIGEEVLKKRIFTDPDNVPNHFNEKIQRKFDYGIIFGTGLEIRTGIGFFILEGRYSFGLSDIFNNTRSDEFQASPNLVLGTKLTYLFN